MMTPDQAVQELQKRLIWALVLTGSMASGKYEPEDAADAADRAVTQFDRRYPTLKLPD